MYTHYTCAYVLAVQLLWLLVFHPAARRPALLANAGAAIAFLPWVPSLLDDLDAPSQDIIGRLAPLNFHNGIDFTARFAFGNPGIPLGTFLGPVAEVALFGGLAVAVAGWIANRGAGEARPSRERVVLFAAMALAAPVGVLFVSIVGDDQFVPRNLATSAPGLLLSISALIMAGTRLTRWVSAVLIVAAFAWGSIANTKDENERLAYDRAAEVLDAEAAPDDVILDINPVSGGQNGAPLTPAARELDIALEEPHTVIDAVDQSAIEAGSTGGRAGACSWSGFHSSSTAPRRRSGCRVRRPSPGPSQAFRRSRYAPTRSRRMRGGDERRRQIGGAHLDRAPGTQRGREHRTAPWNPRPAPPGSSAATRR